MAERIDCLRDCNALCCRTVSRTTFDFTWEEAQFLRANGAVMDRVKDGYSMAEVCPFLDGNICSLHGDLKQPQACGDNVVGGKHCLAVRALYKVEEYEAEC